MRNQKLDLSSDFCMNFVETGLNGSWLIEPEPRRDERGSLFRTFCQEEFAARGLCQTWVQSSTVFSQRCGTLRGMHFQKPPHAEAKLIRCTMGAIYDVIIDLRPNSPTFCQWRAFELSASNRASVYIPEGFAHGLQTLTDNAEVLYMMSAFYQPNAARGVRWNDPAFGIEWPMPPSDERIMNQRDAEWPNFESTLLT